MKNSTPQMTRDRLLQAATTEFSRSGFFNTTVDTITATAGLSHGTFYLYFKNKNEVLSEIMQALFDDILLICPHEAAPQADLALSIRQLTVKLAERSALLQAFVQGMMQEACIFDLFRRVCARIAAGFQARIPAAGRKGPREAAMMAQVMAVAILMGAFIRAEEIIQCSPQDLGRQLVLFFQTGAPAEDPATAPRRQTRAQNDRTRGVIVAAAREVFSAKGYFETTVADIIARAGFSRGTFYKYFKDKDAVLEDIIQEMFRGISTQTDLGQAFINEVDANSRPDLVALNARILEIFAHYTPLNRALLQGAFFSPGLNQNYRQWFQLFSTPVAAKIEEQQRAGLCLEAEPIIAAQIILTTVSYCAFMFNAGLMTGTRQQFAALMGRLLHNFLTFAPAHSTPAP